MYCVQCGTKNPDDARFCKQCGRAMEAAADSAAAAVVDPAGKPDVHLADPEAAYKERLAAAFRHYDHGDFIAARDSCNDALDANPDGTDAHALLSTVYERLNDIDRAIAERERVLQLNPASIADREKLEALRTGIAQVAPRHIVSPRLPSPSFWDNPAGATVAAVLTTIVVIAVGYGVIAYRDSRTQPRDVTPPPSGTLQTNPGAIAQNPPPAMPPTFSGALQSQATPQQPQQPAQQPAMQLPAATSGSGIGPLPVTPDQPRLENSRSGQSADGGSASFFDPKPRTPDRGSNDDAAKPPPAGSSPTANSGGSGRIEIIVAPPGTGADSRSPNTPGGSSSGSMESGNNAAIAQNLQMAGRYREAAQAWERALAGAGDKAPQYHQSAALCYQRIPDNANARRHYNEAIAAYKDWIAAEKDVDIARAGIRASEAGLKLCR